MAAPTALRTWRPQRFGRRAARHIDDPLVEPLWTGVRVLAHVTPRGVTFVDLEGDSPPWPEVSLGLAAAILADSVVLDGYLTSQPDDRAVNPPGVDDAPRVRDVGRRLFGFGNDRRRQELEALREAERPRPPQPGETIVFVAVDLLALDDEELLDVPLLERKRLLDAVVGDGDLVRRGQHVRPPIGAWVATWKGLGFRAIAYKDVNSRYRPGEPNDDWATAPIPVR